jgi:hypothetical protein
MPGRENASASETRLAVVFVQHDRRRYRRALPRLLGALGSLQAETTFVVVDNAVAGDWSHAVSDTLFHVGGDNSAWEFSAFDKGLAWLAGQGRRADVYALATDALLAYGEDFLDLVDDQVVDCCLRRPACVGWIDSFMERCEILGHAYDAWLRTSLLFISGEVLAEVRPLASRLDDADLFGPGPAQPFRRDAPVSENLRRLLLDWLTTNGVEASGLDEGWHSRFRLDASTFPRFKAKVKAILREQLLSARLKALGVACYDFRAVRAAWDLEATAEALGGEAAASWQWLGWRQAEARAPLPSSTAAARRDDEPAAPAAAAPDGWPAGRPRDRRRRPTFLLAGLEERGETLAAIRFFRTEVLPLVAQRHAGARLAVAGADAELLAELDGADDAVVAWGEDAAEWDEAVAVLLPPAAAARREAVARAAARGLPAVGVWHAGADRPAADGRNYLRAERTWEYAAACCRLIDEPDVRARLASGARDLAGP